MGIRKAARKTKSEQSTVLRLLVNCEHVYTSIDMNPYLWRLCTDSMFQLHIEIDERVRSVLYLR